MPRNYNVSLVMLVPEPLAERDDSYLQILAKTDLRDVNSGRLVDDGRRKEAVQRLRRLQALYPFPGWEGNNDDALFAKGEQLPRVSNWPSLWLEAATQSSAR